MTRSSKILAVAFALAALTLWSAPAHAQCPVTTPFGNFFGTVAECDDSGPVTGVLQAIDGNGVLVGTINDSFICLAESQEFCGGTRAGVAGDGLIAFGGDWANAVQVNGCPTDAGGTAGGRNFYNVVDAIGNQLKFSVGRDSLAGFAADNAWPSDPQGNILANLACTNPRSETTLISQTTSEIPGVGLLSQIQLLCGAPQIRSDCDADARGTVLGRGSCTATDPDFLNSLQALSLYSSVQPCDGAVNYGLGAGNWGPAAGAQDQGGGLWNVSVFLPDTGCVYLGCSFGNSIPSTSGNCSSDGSICSVDGDCPGTCSNSGAACADSSACTGLCSIAPLPCPDDATCAGFGLGTCTNPPPGTCDPATCVLAPPEETEYGQVGSALAITADNAPSPVALIHAAGFDKGKAFVEWTTETEVGVAAFEVNRVGRNGELTPIRQVSPKGNSQGATYREEFTPGEFHKQGGKGVVIKTLLTGGGEILSDPASF